MASKCQSMGQTRAHGFCRQILSSTKSWTALFVAAIAHRSSIASINSKKCSNNFLDSFNRTTLLGLASFIT